jgi:GIY-YIG catalytic domain
MPWTIYCHTHIESQRRYIGLAKKTVLQRWNNHVLKSKKPGNSHFWNAINKYGKDAFGHLVLQENITTIELANAAEEFLIEFFCTRDPDFGFNIAKGGLYTPDPERISSSIKSKRNTPEGKETASKATKKLWDDPIFRSKVSAGLQKSQSDPEVRARMTKGIKKRYEDPDERSKNAALWQDSEYRAKCSSGLALGTAKNKNKTHCKNGHEFVAEDTYVNKSGFRACNACRRERRMKKINSGLCECGRSRDSHTQRCIACVIKHENHRQSQLAS